jgi:choline dehydrogenase
MSSQPHVIVVGGGSAGLFAALGLADHARVTLIEAGIDPGSPAPSRYVDEHRYPECDWDYTEADTGVHLVRGKVLGGCSTVNAAAAVRGQPSCFAGWGNAWQWDDVLPTFRAIETDEQFGAAPYHGDAGPVVVTRLAQGPLDIAFLDAAKKRGHADCADHNAPGAFGAGPWPTNRVDGSRWGTLAAVAPLVRGRVDIRASSAVRSLVADGGRVTGVEIDGVAGRETLAADLVILAAGAFGTPEILVRSGLDLAGVGAGLQDHPWISMDVDADADAIMARPVSGGLLRYDGAAAGESVSEIQIFPFSAFIYDPSVAPSRYRMSVGLMEPQSRGSVEVDERNTRIHLKHLRDDVDAERMAAGVRHAGELLEDMATAGVVRLPADPWWQAPDLVAAMRARVESYNHPVGTCAIGSVVDERLRTENLTGLRIADASVMPVIPQANTNLTAMMIGARCAELVLADDFA